MQAGAIKAEDKEVYEYGLTMMFSNVQNLVTAFIVGMVMGQIWECLLFQLAFIPLRTNAGGYHASTKRRCYFLSLVMLILALLGLRYLPLLLSANAGLVILFLSSAVIVMIAPVENKNKPLDQEEKKVYGRRARLILACEVLVGCVCCFLADPGVLWVIALSTLSSALSLIAGIYDLHCFRKER